MGVGADVDVGIPEQRVLAMSRISNAGFSSVVLRLIKRMWVGG